DSSKAGQPVWRSAAMARASAEDAHHLAELLGSVDVVPTTSGAPTVCYTCPNLMRLRIQFGHDSTSFGVNLLLPERIVFFHTDTRWPARPAGELWGSAFCDSIAPGLLDLARRTLRSDSLLAAYSLQPVRWATEGSPERFHRYQEQLPEAVKRTAPKYP